MVKKRANMSRPRMPRARRSAVPEWARPPLLEVQFKDGPRKPYPGWKRKRGSRLSAPDVQFLCLALSKGWTVAGIARALGCTQAAVWARIRRLKLDSGEMYKDRIVVRVELPGAYAMEVFFCRMCGGALDKLADGAVHAFLHVFPDGAGLIPV